MSSSERRGYPGEVSDPSPLGRGCFPMTVVVLLTMAITGGIGYAIGDWPGLGIGAVVGLGLWAHWIWS